MLHWPWQVGGCWEPKANQINSSRPRPGSKVLFVYVCSWVAVDIWSHTLTAVTHYKPLTNGPLAVLYSLVSFHSGRSFVLSTKKVTMNLFFVPKNLLSTLLLFSLRMSQDNRLIGALKQPEAWNEARRGVQSQRYTGIRGGKRVEGRKNEGSRDNEERRKKTERREVKQRANMIGKQTSKQAEWKAQPAPSLVQRFASACVEFLYLPGTNCSAERASEPGSDTQGDEGEAGAAVAADLAGAVRRWNTRLSHWAMFVCLLFYFHPLFIITTTPLSP